MRKNKSQNHPGRALRRRRFPLGAGIAGLVIFLAVFFILGYVWRLLGAAGYFKVKEVLVRNADSVSLSYLKGKNIFGIDLDKEAGYILEANPNYSRVRLIRVFPDRIYADFVKPKPVALVKLYRNFIVDREATLFYPGQEAGVADLPVISGLEVKISGPKPGKRYKVPELSLAISIISLMQANRVLKDFKIRRVNISNTSNVSVFIPLGESPPDPAKKEAYKKPEDLEIRISQDGLKDKIAILGGLIGAAKKELGNIKYIDLRFKEYVIKPKDAK